MVTLSYQLLKKVHAVIRTYLILRSYGVLLWELFSLGQSPYPHLEAGPEFIEAILDRGERLRKPEYASESIFIQIMNQCWADEPGDVENPKTTGDWKGRGSLYGLSGELIKGCNFIQNNRASFG